METNYPQPVNDCIEDFHQSLIESEFYQDYDINPTIGKQAVINQIGPFAFQNWVDGNDLQFSEESIESVLHKIEVDCRILSLIEKGIMESYLDSEGTEMYRLTPLGLAVQQELLTGQIIN